MMWFKKFDIKELKTTSEDERSKYLNRCGLGAFVIPDLKDAKKLVIVREKDLEEYISNSNKVDDNKKGK